MPEKPATLSTVQRHADAAIRLGLLGVADEACTIVADAYPGNLFTHAMLGEIRLEQGRLDEACQELAFVLARDPENVRVLLAVGIAHNAAGRLGEARRAIEHAFALSPHQAEVRDIHRRLSGDVGAETSEEDDEAATSVVRRLLRSGQYGAALAAAQEPAGSDPNNNLLALGRLEALWRTGDLAEAERLCRRLLTRQPALLKPRLILGQILSSDAAREFEGLELLHLALSEDPGGSVASSLFSDSAFSVPRLSESLRVFLPEPLADALLDLDVSIVNQISELSRKELAATRPIEALSGEWNADAGSDASAHHDSGRIDLAAPEADVAFAQRAGEDATRPPMAMAEESEVASVSGGSVEELLDQPPTRDSHPIPNRAAATVVAATSSQPAAHPERLLTVTHRAAITARYGSDGFERLERRLRSAGREITAMGTGFELAVVDDANSMAAFHSEPIASREPAEIKRAIDDAIRSLQTRDQATDPRLGILLVGGDEVLPFFRVPNPADDDDATVLTDNPYGAPEGGWLLRPSIPVGRLPDGCGGNLSLLLRQVDNLVEARRLPRIGSRGDGVLGAGMWALHAVGLGRSPLAAFACATPELEGVASAVVGALAPGAAIQLSPPAVAGRFDTRWLANRRFLYFGLNGGPGGEAWFGQVPYDVEDDSPIPITLTPEQLAGADLQGPVVFSAVGYSADVPGRSATNSVALRFLGEGAAAFVGPSCSCYGSRQPPVAGADLLGIHFLRHVRRGFPIGVALQRARCDVVRQGWESQGYLDGDDQKTLLQFILFGDPLLQVCHSPHDDSPLDQADSGSGELLCNQSPGQAFGPTVPALVRAAVEYLAQLRPESSTGAIRVYRRSACDHSCGHPAHQVAFPLSSSLAADVTAVSSRIELDGPNGAHVSKITRVSVAENGSILKELVSR